MSNTYPIKSVGSGQRLVLFNGIAMMSNVWDPFVESLKETYEVVTFDFPNQNGNVDLSINHYEQYVQYAIDLFEHHGFDFEETHGIGLSFGAEVIKTLNERGYVLRSSILCGLSSNDHEVFWRQYFRAQSQMATQYGPTGLARFMAFNIFSSHALNSNPRLVETLAYSLKTVYDNSIESLKTIVSVPLTSPLVESEFTVLLSGPVLIVHGELDNLVPVKKMEQYAESLGAEFKIIRHSGHMTTIERTEKVLKVIQQYLSKES